MAFFGRNTASNTARFAQDMSTYRADSENKNLREEISKAGQEVLQFFSGLSPEQQADPANVSKLVGILKSKGYSEQALVAGVSAAQGYAKASAQTQSQLEDTKLRKSQNQNIEDTNAAQSALGKFQKLSDNFQVPMEKPEIAAGRGLSDKQFGTYRGALAEIKNNSEQAKYDRMEQMSVINKNNRSGNKGLTFDQKNKVYQQGIETLKATIPGLQLDPNTGKLGGNFTLEEAEKLKAFATANGVNLYDEKGEPIKAALWKRLWTDPTATRNISVLPMYAQIPTESTGLVDEKVVTAVTPKTDTSGLAAAIDSKDMDIVMGPRNDPNAIKVQDIPPTQPVPNNGQTAVPNNGQTAVQKMATGNISGPSIMDALRKKTQSIMSQETKPSLLGQTGAATPRVNKQPSTLEKFETAAPGLNVKTTETKTTETKAVAAYKELAHDYVKTGQEAFIDATIDKWIAGKQLNKNEQQAVDTLMKLLPLPTAGAVQGVAQ